MRATDRSVSKTEAFFSAGKLTPRDVFLAFRGMKPRGVQHLIERGDERACKTCFQWKPRDTFRRIYKNGKVVGHAWDCRECVVVFARRWERGNQDKIKRHRLTSRANMARKRAIGALVLGRRGRGDGTHDLDTLRRALVERPKELESEEACAAYFRGYVAGAKRTGAEDARFSKLQDLCHRIASETRQSRGIGYEDALSAAYEGLLAFIRKSKAWENDEHERRAAAQAIRWAITDYKRVSGPIDRNGDHREPAKAFSQIESEDNPIAPSLAHEGSYGAYVPEVLDQLNLKPMDREMLGLLAQGWKWKEVGEKLGISESRVGQRLANLRKQMGDKLLAALS